MIYYSASNFLPSDEELKLRDRLAYYFNPSLKFLFDHYGRDRFKQYGFNSCRQTAVLGAAFCYLELYGNCEVKCYEADFDDVINVNGTQVHYTHAYFRLFYGNHDWLIDLSRTTKPLLFVQTTPDIIYPHDLWCPDYFDTRIGEIRDLDWKDMIMTDQPEWITGLKPLDLFQQVCQTISFMDSYSSEERRIFISNIYRSFTNLRLERNEFTLD